MTQLWLRMTACDLGRGIDNGSISPLALVKTYINAIKKHPLQNEIYTNVSSLRALKEAEQAEVRAKNNTRLSLLDGVPISWKDLFDSKDINTEAGTLLLSGRVHNPMLLSYSTPQKQDWFVWAKPICQSLHFQV